MDRAAKAEVTNKILKKYGVLIYADTPSEETLTQLQAKKNFRRVAAEENLSTWSAAVFGYGEKVNISFPAMSIKIPGSGPFRR
ncbi:hypothetical protein PS838_02833 [Pseudomonas fluorescens]|nr:hypothetical protein PS838_02833 [Pseudomonas fluorescens]